MIHLAKKSFIKRWLFKKSYNALVTLGGFREIHKYYLIRIQDLIRKTVLQVGERFVNEGRFDSARQMFDLYLKEIDSAIIDKNIDLRAIAYKNTEYMRLYKNLIEMPRVFDSKGRILRLVRKGESANEITAEPISPGVVRGKVKILRHPKEKPHYPGEILVAQATDPGWTPLFVNASGIILGVGGVLQHGSLVAREYGKPCVAGIDDLFLKFRDGMEVELDGSSGIIRLI
jgi:pyruvate,water dikinase